MPGHFCGIAGYATIDGSKHFATRRPRRYNGFHSRSSVHAAMVFPITDMIRCDGWRGGHAAMLSYVQLQSPHYYHGAVWKNYEHELDLYVQFADSAWIHFFKLYFDVRMDPEGPDVPAYPAPVDYWRADRCIFQRLLSPEQWAAMGRYDDEETDVDGEDAALEDSAVVTIAVDEDDDGTISGAMATSIGAGTVAAYDDHFGAMLDDVNALANE